IRVRERLGVLLREGEAPLLGRRGDVVDAEDPGGGLLLQPLPGGPLVGLRCGGELGGRARSVVAERAVEAEAIPEVHGENLARREARLEEPVHERHLRVVGHPRAPYAVGSAHLLPTLDLRASRMGGCSPEQPRGGGSLAGVDRVLRTLPVLLVLAMVLASSGYARAGLTSPQWTSNGPYGGAVQWISIAPSSPNVVYATLHDGRVFRSDDAGESWHTKQPLDFVAQPITVDPGDPKVAYAISREGIEKTTNGASDWFLLFSPGSAVVELAIPPLEPDRIDAVTEEGLFTSGDAGKSWTLLGGGLPDGALFSIAIDPVDPHVLYVASDAEGIFKSVDAGKSWTPANQGFNGCCAQLVIDPTSGSVLYALTFNGLFVSTDLAETWSLATTPWNRQYVSSLVVDPTDPERLYESGSFGLERSANSRSEEHTSELQSQSNLVCRLLLEKK